ncbi:restriction endonuclease [Conexibacter sp. JD483]|uniref:restriction endonuclease n=1 Tax=unclassified Conexibacter TaxID=2627773 RepID=UPI0027234DAC|nr:MULTISPECIES: restriction endonuclease [unclassified Conexibacter]MDO8187722.1 restriction endonuclease [Conexibacter sp. CPCC 205706]MDO8200225.1 restriction endonuclease [Conexibacter sp. CPCC 205762]MDR9369401.1 restriction endonuclease [Conexibacter sp. JD483]
MDLAAALLQFDRADTNLARAEACWNEMRALIPEEITFISGSDDAARYNELARDLRELVKGLPAIHGEVLSIEIPDPDDVAQSRLDAHEIGEISIVIDVERSLAAPGDALAGYRHLLDRTRRHMVRSPAGELFKQVDERLVKLAERVPRDGTSLADDTEWRQVVETITEAERLVGSSVKRNGRWGDLRRHIGFAQAVDLHDIAENDWPSVRADLKQALYAEREPIEIDVADLGALANEQPQGRVSSALAWDALGDDEDFERLVFSLISASDGYENSTWLTKTNAPDRSRDLSVDRVIRDPLAGTIRQRVIIQCKHWRAKSVAVPDVAATQAAMTLWEPPAVDVLVIATTGRFTSDAVAWIEKHNHEGKRPRIEMWADSHLELLLAQRPALVSEFGLRPS